MSSREPDKIVAARIGNAGGVVVGLALIIRMFHKFRSLDTDRAGTMRG